MNPIVPVAAVDRFRLALRRLAIDGRAAPVALAVSGGPDSLALLLLAHAALDGQIEAATVDHALRPESAAEAAMVATICAHLAVPHQTLRAPWAPDAGQGPQAAARAHRYRLLDDWCAARGLSWLLTAHHADDQAETLLLRLARGSGVGGLAAIRAVRPLGPASPVLLGRPLLGFTKAELETIVAEAGLVPARDPSNDSDRYDRTRARHLLAQAPWLDPLRCAASASHLAEAEEALAWAAAAEATRRIGRPVPPATRWSLDPAGLPPELLRRVVAMLVDEIATPDRQANHPPRGPAISRFIARLRAGEATMIGEVQATPGALWYFRPAPPRRG